MSDVRVYLERILSLKKCRPCSDVYLALYTAECAK